MSDTRAAPFFIVGSPRSGTTLLRFMIDRHPHLFIPAETGFVPFLRTPVEVPLSRKQVSYVLQRVGRLNRTWRNTVADPDAFFDALPTPRLADVVDALYRIRMRRHGGERWGDKTPLYVQYIPFLDRLFPRAQFIHVIRDGRDAVVSALEKWGHDKAYFDPYYLLKHWVNNVNTGRAEGKGLGEDRYLEVRYEDLVADSERLLRRICGFLGERLDPTMLVQTDPISTTASLEITPDGPITATRVKRWVSEMSAFEKKLADDLAGPTLSALGYPLSELGGYTPSEWMLCTYLAAKFAVTSTTRTLGYKAGVLTLNRDARSPRGK